MCCCKLTYGLTLHRGRHMHEICSSHFGVKVSSGKVDRPVSELWFLHSTSPTQQHPNLSAHFKARETAGMGCVCVCVQHTQVNTVILSHIWKFFLWSWLEYHILYQCDREAEGSEWQTDRRRRRKAERQADGQRRGQRQTGRQTGGQLRAVTDGMISMSTHAPSLLSLLHTHIDCTHHRTSTHGMTGKTGNNWPVIQRQQRFEVSLRCDVQKQITNWRLLGCSCHCEVKNKRKPYIFQFTSHVLHSFWLSQLVRSSSSLLLRLLHWLTN